MRNARLKASQAGIKTAGRNINNLRYTDDTTLMAGSKEEMNSLSMRKKEDSEKGGLKLKVQKWHLLPSLHGKYMGKKWNSGRFYYPGLQNQCR